MGKKKKGGYDSAVASIWDVMFNSKAKKQGKIKPQKIKEGSEFGKAIGDIATAPAYFLSSEIQSSLSGPLEQSSIFGITGASADRYGLSDKVELKVKVKDLPTLINDPDALVEKMMQSLQDRSKKDGILTFGRGMDAAISLLQGTASGMAPLEAMKFAMANSAFTGLNADKNSDKNIAELSVMQAGGSLKDLSLDEKEKIASLAWKASDNGKMRQKYGSMWFKNIGMTSGKDLSHDVYKTMTDLEKDALYKQMKAETDAEFRSSLSKQGIDSKYHDDIIRSFASEGIRYNANNKNNTRFYSYLGTDGKTPSGMEYSPGMYRDTYARLHEEKIKLIQKDLAIEMGKASPDSKKIAQLLKQIDNNASKAGTAKYAQNVLGYDSMMKGTAYVPNVGNFGADSDKITTQLQVMRAQLVTLSSNVDVTKELAEIDSLLGVKNKAGSVGKMMGSTTRAMDLANNWRNLGKFVGNPGLLVDATGNNIERIAHRTGMLAVQTQIKDFEYRIKDLRSKGITTPEDQAALEVLEHQINVLNHEKKFLNPRRFNMNQWQLGMTRISQYMNMWQTIKTGNIAGSLVTGAFFTSGAFATAIFADPDEGEAVDIQFKDRNGAYKNETLMFFMKNDVKHKSKWWRKQTKLYYFLPQNMIKTVTWDGGGFAYAMSNAQDDFMEEFLPAIGTLWASDPTAKASIVALMAKNKLTGTYTQAEIEEFASTHALELMDDLAGIPGMSKFKEMYSKNILRWKGLYTFFSTPNRVFTNMKNTIVKNGLKKFGLDKILRGTLTLGGKLGGEWAVLVEEMLGSKIGLQQLLKKGIQMLLEPLLAGTGPLGWMATVAIEWFAPTIINKILKPIVSVSVHFMSFAFKVIGIFIILFFLCSCTFMNGILTWGAPTAIISPLEAAGESTNPETLVTYLTTNPGTGTLPISNIKGKCPFKSGTYCTQLPNSDPTCSHGALYLQYGIMAIDAVSQDYFYAPGECVVISAETQSSVNPQCGGKIIVDCTMEGTKVQFTLVHVEKAFTATRISQGKPIAKMETCGTNGYFCCDGCCSTGEHYHVSAAIPNKSQVNTDKLFQGFCGGSYCTPYILCGGDSPIP